MLATRPKALALAVALLLFACALVATNALLPTRESLAGQGRNLDYVYSGAKSQSVELVTGSMGDGDLLLLGSSELSTPPSLVPEIPAVVFGQNNYGLQLACIGEAYDQSLWHAIAAAAYAPHLQNRKVVIIASPSWFFDGGVDNALFQTRFSYLLYRRFMANENLSDETKDYVRTRLVQQGIDETVVRAATAEGPLELANDFAFNAIAQLRLRNQLRSLEGLGLEQGPQRKPGMPDFSQWRAHAHEDARQRSTNEWGFDDEFWSNNVGQYKDQIKGKLAGESFTDTPEYDDFGLLLRVCKEAGLEALVVLAPLSGNYYDWTGVDGVTRRSCYEHIIQIANAYGAQVADFSDREYETYFLHDQVHFGWTGWIDVEEAIYHFAQED